MIINKIIYHFVQLADSTALCTWHCLKLLLARCYWHWFTVCSGHVHVAGWLRKWPEQSGQLRQLGRAHDMSGKVWTTWISDDIGTCPKKKVWNSVSGKYRTGLHLVRAANQASCRSPPVKNCHSSRCGWNMIRWTPVTLYISTPLGLNGLKCHFADIFNFNNKITTKKKILSTIPHS